MEIPNIVSVDLVKQSAVEAGACWNPEMLRTS